MNLSDLVGHSFYVINGNWSGIITQDANTNEFILIIEEVNEVRVIDDVGYFNGDSYSLSEIRKLSDSEYLRILLKYDLVMGDNKESLCIYNDEFYMVEEEALYISKDEEYLRNKQIKLVNDKGVKEVNVDEVCFNYQPKYVEKVYLIKDKSIVNKMIVKSLLDNNRSLKDKKLYLSTY